MNEENKSNPQYTNPNSDGNSENRSNDTHKENFNEINAENNIEKRLEDKPGAFLLKEISVDEEDESTVDKVVTERSDLEEEITEIDEEVVEIDESGDLFNDDELNLDPFVEDDD
jgi:hypothetical protein